MVRVFPGEVHTFRGVEFEVRRNCHVAMGCPVCIECGSDLVSMVQVQLHPKRHHVAWRCHRQDGRRDATWSARSLAQRVITHGLEPAT